MDHCILTQTLIHFFIGPTPSLPTVILHHQKECDGRILLVGLMTEGANKGNIFQPTTIMDLGPKTDFLKEILLTPEFQGYIIDEVESTSYQDISGILNLFIISRLI